ncbi:MAG: succinate--CoA ligase subunit beta, partial [Actinobacteria bacterium]|nr:succinate--CoA ligase subunit beta [Actinomycetota bacterium]
GKAGGIKFADTGKDARKICSEMLGMVIKNIVVKKVLIAQKVDVLDEWYLSVILDRLGKGPMVIFSPLGGVDIEETAKTCPDKIAKIAVNPLLGVKDYTARYIFKKYNLDNAYFEQFLLIIKNLYRLFNQYDCTLLEINPLAVTDGGKLLAVDCKTDIDDSSLYRHADILEYRATLDENKLITSARKFNFLYIPIDGSGDIAVASNGSGMLMSCIDLITRTGAKVGAALDLSGGATSDRIAEAVKIIFDNQKTKYLFVSIFGGITRCDEVAQGVKLALQSGLKDKTIVIRLEGTNKAAALEILESLGSSVIPADSISDGVKKLKSARND